MGAKSVTIVYRRSHEKMPAREIELNEALKDGTKIISKLTQEKFEETAVLRKKRNYVMYESKLKTEKNTQIMKI